MKKSLLSWLVLALITAFVLESVDLLLLYAIPAYPQLFVSNSGAHYTSHDFDSEVRINDTPQASGEAVTAGWVADARRLLAQPS